MKKLAIGILTEIINYHSGSRAPLELSKVLAQRGHTVIVYAYSVNLQAFARKDLEKNGVLVSLFSKSNALFGTIFTSFFLLKHLLRNPPQVIIFSGTLPFFLAAKATGIPIILIYMGTQFDALLEKTIPQEKVPVFIKMLNVLANCYIYFSGLTLFRLSKKVVAISRYAKHEGEKLYRRKADMIIYPNTTSFDITNSMPGEIKKKDYISLLSVSRITPYKGFHLIIEALKQIKIEKKIRFIIVGSFPKQNYVQYLKKIGGKNLTIVVNPTDKILSTLYQNTDIYVCADRYLFFGLPIFEAATFGKPTLSLNYAAASELIQNGKTGYVANDVHEFSYYLKKLIEDEKLIKKLGYNALRWSKAFSWEECAEKWAKILSYYAK